jgi:hypothetical protein
MAASVSPVNGGCTHCASSSSKGLSRTTALLKIFQENREVSTKNHKVFDAAGQQKRAGLATTAYLHSRSIIFFACCRIISPSIIALTVFLSSLLKWARD